MTTASASNKIGEYLRPGKCAHLVGIGGVSMRPLGLVLRSMGMKISGSDMNASVSLEELIVNGITVHIGHSADNIIGADCVIRTAAALGFDSVILCGACADVYSPKTARATMGAIFRENILRMDIAAAAEYIHSRGMKLYGAALSERAADIRTAELKNAVVAIGSEGRGLSAELLSLCDGEVIIPMTPGSESFNAAIAAAIVMWEIVR